MNSHLKKLALMGLCSGVMLMGSSLAAEEHDAVPAAEDQTEMHGDNGHDECNGKEMKDHEEDHDKKEMKEEEDHEGEDHAEEEDA